MEGKEKIIQVTFKEGAVYCKGGIPPKFFNHWALEDAISITTETWLNTSEVIKRFESVLTEEDKKKLTVYGTGGETPPDFKKIFYGTE
tara:strand:- start:2397 stop:2660 length:264 start_codon:yes stop_codon:yes gene_type:complete